MTMQLAVILVWAAVTGAALGFQPTAPSRLVSRTHAATVKMVGTGQTKRSAPSARRPAGGGGRDSRRKRDFDDFQSPSEFRQGTGRGRGGTGGGGGGRQRRYGDNDRVAGEEDVAKSADPWKVLIRKFDEDKPKGAQVRKVVGKVAKASKVVDDLQCPHFAMCSGCSMQGNFTDAPIIKQAKNFFNSESIDYTVHMGEKHHWRTHAKLAVQAMSRWGGIKIGLYQAGSHIVEPIPNCKVHHPRINEAVEVLKEACKDVGVTGYLEGQRGQPAEGDLRYLQMTVDRNTKKIQLVLVWNAVMYKDASQSLQRLVKKLKSMPDLWHSISVNFQTSPGNAIFNMNAKAWKVLWGNPLLKETIGDADFYFKPQVFRQSNLDLFESGIIPLVVENVIPGSLVSELYSGIGVLGLNVAAKGKATEVLCSDCNEHVDEVFDKCADSLPEEYQESVFYENLNAEEAVEQGQCNDAQVLIVDPPRKGLDDGVMDLLLDRHEIARAERLRRLIYVSCGYNALERDTRALLASGKWKVASADGFVLFPGSDHVESVVVYDRVDKLPAR